MAVLNTRTLKRIPIFAFTQEAKQREAEAAYQAQLMEDLTASDPNAQAEEMLKMKTMRIRKAE